VSELCEDFIDHYLQARRILVETVADDPQPEYHDDTFNAAAVDRLGRLAPAEQHAEFEAAGEAFVAMLRGLPDEAFEDGAPASSWAAGLTGHALEHAEAIYHAE
jgi:hypothetical protein